MIFKRPKRQISVPFNNSSTAIFMFSQCFSLHSPLCLSRFLLLLLSLLYISLSFALSHSPLFLFPCPHNNVTKYIQYIFPAANEPKLPNHISSTRISLTFALQARVRSQCPCSSSALPSSLSLSFSACLSICLSRLSAILMALPRRRLRFEQHVSRTCQLDAPENFGGADFLRGNTRGQEVRQARQECGVRSEEESGQGGGTRHMKNVEV